MAEDFEHDARAESDAPEAWTETMALAALEESLAEDGSISAAIARAGARLGAWAGDLPLADAVTRLWRAGRIAFDPPLVRAMLSDGAELAVSTALIRWPADPRDELETVARAQTLLAAGAKLGIAGAPSNAALDALDAAARMADPDGADGAAILVRPSGEAALGLIAADAARTRASAALAAGARALDAVLAELAIEAVRNGFDREHGGVLRRPPPPAWRALDADILAALSGQRLRAAPMRKRLDLGSIPPAAASARRVRRRRASHHRVRRRLHRSHRRGRER
ncbi:MAG: hypothetical protein R3C16_08750 [Hyphomonadaceae bacterium]